MDIVLFKDSSSANYASDDDIEYLEPADLDWNSNAMELSYNTHQWNHYPSSLPLSLLDKTLLYRFEVMTPRMPRTAGVNNPFIESWFPISLTDNSAFSSLIMSSLTHRRTLWLISGKESMEPFESEEQQLLEDSYKDSVKTLNKRMKDPRAAITDTTILAVFMMIEQPISSLGKDWRKESPFNAPLQELQWLNIHGAREPNIPHHQGLCKLVELRGGLANIELPGLAAAISYRVLVNAILTLSTPSLPFFPLSGDPNLQLQDIIHSDSNAFPVQLSNLYSVGFAQDLVEVFQATASYTSTLQRYVSGETYHLDTQTMCDQRNLLQHRIFSLPSTQHPTESNGLYEICRISLIIYSIGVTFPLPGVGAPFIPLSTELKVQLQSLGLDSILASVPESSPIVLWVLTMGCIAAMDSAEWPWFVAVLSKHTVSTHIIEWNQFKQELKKVLWLDSACDMAGKLLWKEVQMLRQFEEFAAQSLLPPSTTHPDLIEMDTPCGHCRAKKLKCDKKVPCHNCIKGDLLCSPFIETEALKPARVHVYSTRKRPCELCRQRRVRCDKQKPCQNCIKGCYTCSYS